VWSCGVILFALLVGALPFDDDNLRNLLEKVKRGNFTIPHFVPPDAQNLLRGMIEVNPERRLTLQQVLSHRWMMALSSSNNLASPSKGSLLGEQTRVSTMAMSVCDKLTGEEDADPDVIASMVSLGCFRDKTKLLNNLLSKEQNTEKVVYYMLLKRKKRCPSFDDDADSLPCKHPDAPRKRVDSTSSRSSLSSSSGDLVTVTTSSMFQPDDSSSCAPYSSHQGKCQKGKQHTTSASTSELQGNSSSGRKSRQGASSVEMLHNASSTNSVTNSYSMIRGNKQSHRTRSLSSEHDNRIISSSSNHEKRGHHVISPSKRNTSSCATNDKKGTPLSVTSQTSCGNNISSSTSSSPWRNRLNIIKNSFFGSPRFHRRKIQVPASDSSSNQSLGEPPDHSWFGKFTSRSSSTSSSGSSSSSSFFSRASKQDDVIPLTLVMNKRTLNNVKADLIHAFLTIANLTHELVTPTSFRCEYKVQGTQHGMIFTGKVVKFRADIIQVSSGSKTNLINDSSSTRRSSFGNYHVAFQILSGNNRRFRRVLELIQIKLTAQPYIPVNKPAGEISQFTREMEQLYKKTTSSVTTNSKETSSKTNKRSSQRGSQNRSKHRHHAISNNN